MIRRSTIVELRKTFYITSAAMLWFFFCILVFTAQLVRYESGLMPPGTSPLFILLMLFLSFFGLFVTAFVFSVAYRKYSQLGNQTVITFEDADEEGEAGEDNPSDILSFDAQGPDDILLIKTYQGNIRMGRLELAPGQWEELAFRLRDLALLEGLDYWPWKRDVLKGLLKNYTAPGVYTDINKTMQNIGAASGNEFTDAGRIAICRAAGFDRVI